jgi:hypothetical protein
VLDLARQREPLEDWRHEVGPDHPLIDMVLDAHEVFLAVAARNAHANRTGTKSSQALIDRRFEDGPAGLPTTVVRGAIDQRRCTNVGVDASLERERGIFRQLDLTGHLQLRPAKARVTPEPVVAIGIEAGGIER